MNHSISKKLLKNYILMFLISTLLLFIFYCLLLLSDSFLSKRLISRIYTADYLMTDDYNQIQADKVVRHNGSVQVVTKDLNVINLGGTPAIKSHKLTAEEWSDFLINSKKKGNKYNYSIKYNSSKNFWLVVTFPVSIRIYFGIIMNLDNISKDLGRVLLILTSIISAYILMLVISTLIYSKISSSNFVEPIRALCKSTKELSHGNYKERIKPHMISEFAELEGNFNNLANQLETQTKLKEESENKRKRMILNISHDLKNPLSSVMGYSELCLQRNLDTAKQKKYIQIIYNNSARANELIMDLFEFSKVDSPDFKLSLKETDICEFLREKISDAIPLFDEAKFKWDFNIPETEVMMQIDSKQMNRVFYNLFSNAIKYNPKGTILKVSLHKEESKVIIIVSDNGIGIDKNLSKDIFSPFVRTDSSRNSETGGSGLGLAIVKKIIEAHNGTIELVTDKNCGCQFNITLPI